MTILLFIEIKENTDIIFVVKMKSLNEEEAFILELFGLIYHSKTVFS